MVYPIVSALRLAVQAKVTVPARAKGARPRTMAIAEQHCASRGRRRVASETGCDSADASECLGADEGMTRRLAAPPQNDESVSKQDSCKLDCSAKYRPGLNSCVLFVRDRH